MKYIINLPIELCKFSLKITFALILSIFFILVNLILLIWHFDFKHFMIPSKDELEDLFIIQGTEWIDHTNEIARMGFQEPLTRRDYCYPNLLYILLNKKVYKTKWEFKKDKKQKNTKTSNK